MKLCVFPPTLTLVFWMETFQKFVSFVCAWFWSTFHCLLHCCYLLLLLVLELGLKFLAATCSFFVCLFVCLNGWLYLIKFDINQSINRCTMETIMEVSDWSNLRVDARFLAKRDLIGQPVLDDARFLEKKSDLIGHWPVCGSFRILVPSFRGDFVLKIEFWLIRLARPCKIWFPVYMPSTVQLFINLEQLPSNQSNFSILFHYCEFIFSILLLIQSVTSKKTI